METAIARFTHRSIAAMACAIFGGRSAKPSTELSVEVCPIPKSCEPHSGLNFHVVRYQLGRITETNQNNDITQRQHAWQTPAPTHYNFCQSEFTSDVPYREAASIATYESGNTHHHLVRSEFGLSRPSAQHRVEYYREVYLFHAAVQ
jgi:hypothetical protein